MTHTEDEEAFDFGGLDQFEAATAGPSDWLNDAACSDMDLNLFFDYNVQAGPSLEALRACLNCPVRSQCLDTISRFESSSTNKGKGLFAGMTPTVRLRFFNQTARQDWDTINTAVIQEQIAQREKIGQTESDFERTKREVSKRLVAKPNKRTQYCKTHNYPIVTLRSTARGNDRVLLYGCYAETTAHYLYTIGEHQLLNREEYEALCAAQ
jgi:hypothetical protein